MPACRVYAVMGVSLTDPSKYGTRIFKDLLAAGYRVYAVNPKGGELLGNPVYKTLAELPAAPDAVIMVLPPAALDGAVAQCIAAGVKEIWFQPGARDERARQKAQTAGIKTVESCFMAENGIW